MTPKTQSVCKHKHTEQRLSQGHAAPQTSAEPKKQCGCVHGDSDPYCHDPLCPNYIAAYHVKSVALQPVSEDAPKVEEIARKINRKFADKYGNVGVSYNDIDMISDVLRPYFPKEKE